MVDVITPMNTRIRLVRCPKCRKILAEPDIPVYKCGGCDTVLEAKSRKNEIKQTDLDPHKTNSSKNFEDERVSDGSNQESNPPALESSPENEYKGDENGIEKQNEHPGDTKLLEELPSSSELRGDGTAKLSIEAMDSMKEGKNKFPLREDECISDRSNQESNSLVLESSPEIHSKDNEYAIEKQKERSGPSSRELSGDRTEKLSIGAVYTMKEGDNKFPLYEDDCVSDGSNQESTSLALEYSPENHSKDVEYGVEKKKEQPGPSSSELSGDGTEKLSIGTIYTMKEGENKFPLYENECVSDGSNEESIHPAFESSPENDSKDNEYGVEKQNEQSGDTNFLEKLPSSSELSSDGAKKLSVEAIDTTTMEEGENKFPLYEDECVSNGSNQESIPRAFESSPENDEYEIEKLNKQPGDTNSLKELPSSSNLISDETEILSVKAMDTTEEVKNKSSLGETLNHDSIRALSNELVSSGELSYLENEDKNSTPLKQRVDRYGKEAQVNFNIPLTNESNHLPEASSLVVQNEDENSENRSKVSDVEDTLSPMKEAENVYVKGKVERMSSSETFKSLPVMTKDHPRHGMSKSPTRIYYARDASESSYDGIDDEDEVPLYRRKSKTTTDPLSTLRSRRKDTYSRAHKMENTQGLVSSSKFELESHDEEVPEPRRHPHSVRRRMKLDIDEPIPRKSHILQRNRSPDKMELLKMVYDLENKINQTHLSRQMDDRKFSSGYEDRYTRGIGWSGQSKISRIGFSGEAYNRHQVDHSCSHCHHYSHELQYSRHSPSPSRSISCSKCQAQAQAQARHSHNLYKPFTSHSSTPQHYTSSEISTWDQERKHNEYEAKRLYMEKYHSAKRHLRPVAGGAPIIICSHCSELLQLPMDFLIFNKRQHQLRCNSCNKVQKFALKKKVHLVPYVPNFSTPHPSEVDKDTNSRTPYVDPVSCSDDHDPFFSASRSIERPPLVPKKKSTMEERKGGRVFRSPESIGSSSNMLRWGNSTSEIQEVGDDNGGGGPLNSPLHRLMGYSSPSHVIYAPPGDESEVEIRSKHNYYIQ